MNELLETATEQDNQLPCPSRQETEEELSRASVELLLSEPFFAHMLGGLPRVISLNTPTAAVSWDGRAIRLLINPRFFITEINREVDSKDQTSARAAILKHELLHIVFGHLFRQNGRNKEIENIAADLVVCQYIGNWYEMDGGVNLKQFEDLKLEPFQTLGYYYGKLIALYREMESLGFGLPLENANESGKGPQGQTNEEGQDGKGGKESESGDEWMQDLDLEKICQQTSAPQSAKSLGKLLIGMHLRKILCGDHSFWGLDKGAGKYQAGTLVLRSRERMTASQWGSMPSYLRTALEGMLDGMDGALDWKRLLRIFCNSSYKTKVRHTMKRQSKRYGTRPGIKVQRFSRLLVAVDTSGSIDQDTMQSFFTEIHAIWISGASVTILECDATIHKVYEYEGKTPDSVNGNGGTDFEPVFQWMKEHPKFDGFIYLTDGYAPEPETPPECRMLWVIPEHCHRGDNLPFGDTVWIPNGVGSETRGVS